MLIFDEVLYLSTHYNIDRNRVLELLNEGGSGLGGWFQLRFYIEQNSNIKIPTRKSGRNISIGSWVKQNLDWIAPC